MRTLNTLDDDEANGNFRSSHTERPLFDFHNGLTMGAARWERSIVYGDPNLRGTGCPREAKRGFGGVVRLRLRGFGDLLYVSPHRKALSMLARTEASKPLDAHRRCFSKDCSIYPPRDIFMPLCAFPLTPQWLKSMLWRCEYAEEPQWKLIVRRRTSSTP